MVSTYSFLDIACRGEISAYNRAEMSMLDKAKMSIHDRSEIGICDRAMVISNQVAALFVPRMLPQ